MRKLIWLGALGLPFAVTLPATAQSAKSFGGLNGQQTVNVPIDMSRAVPPPPAPQIPGTKSGFSLTNFVSSLLPGKSRAVPSPLPGPAAFPSTHYPNAYGPALPSAQVLNRGK